MAVSCLNWRSLEANFVKLSSYNQVYFANSVQFLIVLKLDIWLYYIIVCKQPATKNGKYLAGPPQFQIT